MINEAKASVTLKAKLQTQVLLTIKSHTLYKNEQNIFEYILLDQIQNLIFIILIFVQKKATFMFMYWNKSALVMR